MLRKKDFGFFEDTVVKFRLTAIFKNAFNCFVMNNDN